MAKQPLRAPVPMPPIHPRYDRGKPLLRELVSASIWVYPFEDDPFIVTLSRVPGVGEEIVIGADSYRLTRVMHSVLDDDGRSRFGPHAYADAVPMPPDPPRPSKQRRRGPISRASATR